MLLFWGYYFSSAPSS